MLAGDHTRLGKEVSTATPPLIIVFSLAGDHTRLGKEVSTATPPLIIVFSLAGDHTRLGRLSQKSENQQKFSNASLLSTLLNTRATMTLAVENFYPAGIETRISQMEETITHQHNLVLHRLDHLSTLLFVRTPSAHYAEPSVRAPPVSVSSPLSPPSLPADPPVPSSPLASGLRSHPPTPMPMTSTPPIKPWQVLLMCC